MPHGDTPTRQGFFDCTGLGDSIPVVFDPNLVEFYPFSDLVDYEPVVHYIDPAALWGGKDVIELLLSISESTMFHKLGALHRIRHILQYASAPQHLLVRYDQLQAVDSMDDAFTASFKAVMRNCCRRSLLPRHRCEA